MAMASTITTPVRREGESCRKRYFTDAAFFYFALAGLNGCKAKTPVQEAFDIWRSARATADTAPEGFSVSKSDHALALADEVVQTPSQEPRDVLLKIAAYTFFGEHAPCDGPLGHLIYKEVREWAEAA
ncbi:hypothetical protein [Roseinatronobacter sp. NSM]|uniref:hypothetical protein n=1 Tax=Roseinatronobacter sp. NSM TaxID=3457785 RepID=UPI004035EED3